MIKHTQKQEHTVAGITDDITAVLKDRLQLLGHEGLRQPNFLSHSSAHQQYTVGSVEHFTEALQYIQQTPIYIYALAGVVIQVLYNRIVLFEC